MENQPGEVPDGSGLIAHRGLLKVGAAGGVAGAINATLCYLQWPVPVREPAVNTFHWHVVPAGFAHGATLALAAVLGLILARGLRAPIRWCGLVVVAWVAGYLSWIPLDLSVSTHSVSQALAWPADAESPLVSALWSPLLYFGGVAGMFYAWGLLLEHRRVRRPWGTILAAGTAGTLGSLWWWIEWGPWYFSLLHGSLWGCLVGLALSRQAAGLGERRSHKGE